MFEEIHSSWTNSDALNSLRHFMKSSWMSWEINVKCSNLGAKLSHVWLSRHENWLIAIFQEIHSSWTNSDALDSLRHFNKSSWMSWETNVKCSKLGLLLKRTTGKRNEANKKTTSKMKRIHQTERQGRSDVSSSSCWLSYFLPCFSSLLCTGIEEDQSTHSQQQLCRPLQEAAEWRAGMLKTVNTSPAVMSECPNTIRWYANTIEWSA